MVNRKFYSLVFILLITACDSPVKQDGCQLYPLVCKRMVTESEVNIIVTLKMENDDKEQFTKLLTQQNIKVLTVFKYTPQLLLKINRDDLIFLASRAEVDNIQLDRLNKK